MAAKLTTCKACGGEMAKSARACPKCGAKNKKPIYQKWWFWVILVCIVMGVVSGGSGDSDPAPQESRPQAEAPNTPAEPAPAPAEVSYAHYDVTELFDVLNSNALKAEKTFQDQYVELEGYLSNIDSDGDYISIGAHPDNYDYFLASVQCYIRDEGLLDQILDLQVDDPITVRGQITDIGEVLGYSMTLDSIN